MLRRALLRFVPLLGRRLRLPPLLGRLGRLLPLRRRSQAGLWCWRLLRRGLPRLRRERLLRLLRGKGFVHCDEFVRGLGEMNADHPEPSGELFHKFFCFAHARQS